MKYKMKTYSVAYVHYEDAGDFLWMLLSVLTLPPIEQERIIGGINSNKDECGNHLVQFLNTLEKFQDAFYDHFDFESDSDFEVYKEFHRLLTYGNFRMDAEGFYNGEDWTNLRKCGAELLKTTGLPIYEPLDVIDFRDFLEFVYDKDGNIVGLN